MRTNAHEKGPRCGPGLPDTELVGDYGWNQSAPSFRGWVGGKDYGLSTPISRFSVSRLPTDSLILFV